MEIGSLVQCVNAFGIKAKKALKKPVVGQIYTVTGFFYGGRGLGIFIEECNTEIICLFNDGSTTKMSSPFLASRFEEVLPPMEFSIQSITEKVNS